MTIGIILIVAILVLGGVLATAGDRIGTKVGKARLSLFNLRPKKTATLITIVTGITISASTLGILFATSKPLRKGIFEYDQIQEKIREIRRELDRTIAERDRVKTEFEQARNQQSEAQKKLKATNQALQLALGKLNQAVSDLDRREEELKKSQLQLSQTQAQKTSLQTEIQQRTSESQALLKQLQQGRVQIEQQNQKIQQKTAEIEQTNRNIQEKNRVIDLKNQQIEQANQTIQDKNQDIEQTNQLLAEKNQAIDDKNEVIDKQEAQLEGLENQQTFLEREIQSLEKNFQELQVGTIVLRRGQVLASQVLEIMNPPLAVSTIEELLVQANQEAFNLTQPGTNNPDQQMIQIPQAQLQEVIDEISNGEEYVVRIISAANYVLGEKQVQVFIDAARNQVIFQPADVVAATSIDPKQMSSEQVRERIDLLLAASSFRARRMGILSETAPIIAGDNIQSLFQFFAQLRQQTQPVDIKAVASKVTYTAGPLMIELVAVRNGQILFQTCSPNTQLPSCQ